MILVGSSSLSTTYSVHDSDDRPFIPSNSDTESFHESDLEEDNLMDIVTEEDKSSNDKIEVGDYVLVKFLSGKNSKYYVGKIIDCINNELTTKYLRKNQK